MAQVALTAQFQGSMETLKGENYKAGLDDIDENHKAGLKAIKENRKANLETIEEDHEAQVRNSDRVWASIIDGSLGSRAYEEDVLENEDEEWKTDDEEWPFLY